MYQIITIIMLGLVSSQLLAQQVYQRVDNDQLAPQKNRPKQILLREERLLDTSTSEIDFDAVSYYTGADSVGGHFAYSVGAKGQATLNLTFKKKLDDYAKHWLLFSYSNTSATFGGISENLSGTPSGIGSDRHPDNLRPSDANQSLTSYGIGHGHRFRFLVDLFEDSNLFESVGYIINRTQLQESHLAQSYAGYGLQTFYSVEKRLNTTFYIAGKMSYHMAVVSRGSIADEPKGERTLSLAWLDFGAVLGFYF